MYRAWALVLLISLSEAAIISQSSISDCNWGDDSEPSAPGGTVCRKKMLISMVLGSGQGNTESLHANVDRAHEEGREEMSVLKKPFRIELRKTAVVVSYRAYLIGTANALPSETSISKKGCVDDFYANPKKLPCGMQYDELDRPVWDSQGFCCICGSFEASYNKRGGHSCEFGYAIQDRGSAHCMKMDDLWYDIYTLEMPMMQYKITLDVLELKDIVVNNATKTKTVTWTPISTFHLSPSRTIGRSKTGRVIAEIQGSLLGSKSIKDLSTKMLLIPSVRMWPKRKPYPPAYTNGQSDSHCLKGACPISLYACRMDRVTHTNGPSDWMLVDTSLVQLLGTECNKIGVQYTGFRRQPGRCQTEAGFCFHNQPLQLWGFDNELRNMKQSGRYMIHNFGTVHHDSHPNNDSFILKFLHDDLHNSFVTLRIDATDIAFVKSVSSGRIVETYTAPFTATVGHGALTVEVGNTGEVSSEYSVSVVKCDSGLYDMAAKSLSLEPGEVKNTTFTLRSGDLDGGGKECEVQLYDSTFNLIDTARVNIKVGAACLCFGICGCVCDGDKMGPMDCSKPGPPTIYKPGPIALTLFVMVLESIGAHGFIGFFGGLLLILGFIKLSFGGIICCRKTKAQKHQKKLLEKGVAPKSPLLVQCSGECRGAKAARARYMRKVKRLRAAGKSPHRLDDWRNTSFECHCKTELTDIRMIHVVRTVCFFYFCCILPFIWIGRCLVWRVFRDTEANKAKAEQEVLQRAKKKGNLEKYGIIDLATELKKFEEETVGREGNKEAENKEDGKKETDDGKDEVVQVMLMKFPTDSDKKKDKAVKEGPTKAKGEAKGEAKNKKGTGKERDRKGKQPKTKHQNQQLAAGGFGDMFGEDRRQRGGFEGGYEGGNERGLVGERQGASPGQRMRPQRGPREMSPNIKRGPYGERQRGRQTERGGERQSRGSKQRAVKGERFKGTSIKTGTRNNKPSAAPSKPKSQHADKQNSSHGQEAEKGDSCHSQEAGKEESHHSQGAGKEESHHSEGSHHSLPVGKEESHHSEGSHHSLPVGKEESHHSQPVGKEESVHSGNGSTKPEISHTSVKSDGSLHQSGEGKTLSSPSVHQEHHSGSEAVSQHGSLAAASQHSSGHHSGPHTSHSDHSGSHASHSDHSGSHASHSDHSGSHASYVDRSGSHASHSDHSGSHASHSDHSGSHASHLDLSGSHGPETSHISHTTSSHSHSSHHSGSASSHASISATQSESNRSQTGSDSSQSGSHLSQTGSGSSQTGSDPTLSGSDHSQTASKSSSELSHHSSSSSHTSHQHTSSHHSTSAATSHTSSSSASDSTTQKSLSTESSSSSSGSTITSSHHSESSSHSTGSTHEHGSDSEEEDGESDSYSDSGDSGSESHHSQGSFESSHSSYESESESRSFSGSHISHTSS